MKTLAPASLRCEYRVNPLGIDVVRPGLSWILESDARNQRQTAYRVLVADSREALDQDFGALWDSGRVETDQTAPVYAGQALKSRQRAYWKVRVWDRDGRASDWSPTAFWTMGLLEREEWQARWIGYDAPYAAVVRSGHLAIHGATTRSLARALLGTAVSLGRRLAPEFMLEMGRKSFMRLMHWILTRQVPRFAPILPPCPYLRREFRSGKPIRGTLYASALGIYDLRINDNPVSDGSFAPGWTDYNRRVYYQTYDVTSLLAEGDNAIGAILSDGWYAGYIGPEGRRGYYGVSPRLAVQLEIEYADGSATIVPTDSTWKATTGPHLEADLLMGETYDARKELTGWTQPGYDDSAWSPVTVAKSISASLQAMPHVPVRKMGEIRPVRLSTPRPGCYVYDMGRNFAGWVRVKVNGKAGTRVVLRFAERLNSDGTIYTANLRRARATDTYVLRGAGEEEWEPRFTYHGFQYVELTGYPGTPDLETITGIVVHSAAPAAGWFECSHGMINTLYENIRWTQRANFIDIPTDCPQRDERLGWLGDAQVFARTGTYNMDVASLFSKWLVDLADAQSEAGAYPDFAPRIIVTRDGSPGWADAGVICPWTLYWVYGDTRVVAQHYTRMKQWIEYIHEANPDLLWTRRTGSNHGEWLALDDRTPRAVLATAYFAYSTSLLARMAAAIGQAEDAEKYDRLCQAIKRAFNRAYVATDGRVKGDTQTGYVLALHFGLLPEALRTRSARWLVDAIERAGGHLSTGFFGTAYLAMALTANGYLDTAYQLLLNETFPSWGYWIRHGATSVWERWDGWTEERGFQDPTMNSFCHCAFGSIGEWLFTAVAGIDTEGPGFNRVVIRPRPGGGLTYARAHYDSIHGRISTHWKIEEGRFHLDMTIPANTTATVFVPTRDAKSVTEGGRPLGQARDIEIARIDDGSVVLKIGSGRYQFCAKADSSA
jgi:alpha-L-rhamnosidase